MSLAVAPCRTIRRYPSIQEKQSFSSRSAASGEEKTGFATPDVASALFEAVRFYERKQQWFIHLLVLMPITFISSRVSQWDAEMKDIVAHWKRYTSIRAKIHWQGDFFDHRLRGDESRREKAEYILQNPVRANLARPADDWPFVLMPE